MVRWYLMLLLVVGVAGRSRASELTPKQVTVLERIAREKFAPRWDLLGTNELGELRLKVEAYEAELRKSHLVGGLVVSLRYADTNRTQVISYEALEESAAWSGFYLANESMRYVVERKPATLEVVRQVLDGIERLIQSSGRPGYLPRFAGPAGDVAYQAVYSRYGGADPQRPGFGRLAFPGTNGLVWLAGPSRESYSGLNLGLALTHHYVREVGIRQRVSNIVDRILRRIEQDGGVLNDGRGQLEFLTPQLHSALLRTGASVVGREWAARYEAVSQLFARQYLADSVGPVVPRFDDIRPFVFTTAELLTLNRLETNKMRKTMYQEGLSKLWRSGAPELNPWFAGAFISVDDLRQSDSKTAPFDSTAIAILQGVLRQYPAWPRWAASESLAVESAPALVEANGRLWSRASLPVFSRPVKAFQWTQSGREWSTNLVAEPVVHPGLDLLLPYWLARNAGIILPEDLPPLKRATARPAGGRPGTTNALGRLVGTNAAGSRAKAATAAPAEVRPEPPKPAEKP